MRRIGRNFCGFILLCVFGLGLPRGADASAEVRRAAIVSTAVEAALATATLTNDRGPDKIKGLSWSVDYSERNWTTTLEGKIQDEGFRVRISGYLWGEDKEDWLISYSGSGAKGKEPVALWGQAVWKFDKNKGDHTTMDFRQVVKFGTNSVWQWMVGAEIIVGSVLGAAVAVTGSTIVTAGVTLPVAIIIGAGGAVTGANGLASISNTVKSTFTDATAAPPQPSTPQRPAVPLTQPNLSPAKDKMHIVVERDGQVAGSGPDGSLVLSGKLNNGIGKDGTGTGSITAR